MSRVVCFAHAHVDASRHIQHAENVSHVHFVRPRRIIDVSSRLRMLSCKMSAQPFDRAFLCVLSPIYGRCFICTYASCWTQSLFHSTNNRGVDNAHLQPRTAGYSLID